MAVTSNTSPLIALAKIGRLKLLKDLYGAVLIPPFVKVESVDRGKELGAPDALEVEKAMKEGWITEVKLSRKQKREVEKLIERTRVGLGEAGALILAKEKRITSILDDKEARAIAKSWEINHIGTVMVLYEALVKNLIRYDQLVEDLAKLTRVMWIGTDVITEIIRRAKEVVK